MSASGTEVAEGENIYLEAQYGPLDDNTIQSEWLFNGQPLMKAHRFVLSQDFGFAALSILYMYPEDRCHAINFSLLIWLLQWHIHTGDS